MAWFPIRPTNTANNNWHTQRSCTFLDFRLTVWRMKMWNVFTLLSCEARKSIVCHCFLHLDIVFLYFFKETSKSTGSFFSNWVNKLDAVQITAEERKTERRRKSEREFTHTSSHPSWADDRTYHSHSFILFYLFLYLFLSVSSSHRGNRQEVDVPSRSSSAKIIFVIDTHILTVIITTRSFLGKTRNYI